MPAKSKNWGPLALLVAGVVLSGSSHAQSTLLDEVHTVAAANQAVPAEHSFNISVPGTYTVTLVDLGAALATAAPLSSVKLAITMGNNVVGIPLLAAGSAQFNATAAGAYVIHVVGTPGTTPGSGPIGIQITDANSVQVAAFSDTLALPSTGLPNDEGVLDGAFTVPTTGNYQIVLSDLQFPQSLGVLTLALAQEGGSLVTTLPGGPSTVSLQAGANYRIFAVGQSTGAVNAGLYGVNITPAGGGAAVYGQTVPVGIVASIGQPALTAENYTLGVSDLQFPTPLQQVGAAVTLKGIGVAQLTAAGTPQVFAASADTYQVFAIGVPSGTGVGSYWVGLQSAGGVSALSGARAVSAAGSATSAYTFDASVAGGQTYAFDLADFAVPSAFTSITAAAVQGGSILGSPLTAVGSKNITPAAGPVSLLVFAHPAATGGLLGVDLTASGADNPTFVATQGVGQLFTAREVIIASAGAYQVAVADVGFPAMFKNLAVIVTRGSNLIGSIFSGGTFNFPATSGHYEVNFVAQPADAAGAGTYAMSVAPAPPAPTATLKSSADSVDSGGAVTLTWTSQNATSCTASGGWSGSQAVNGKAVSAAITAVTTFTLTCTGAGGTATQSVTVNLNAAAPGGSHSGAIGADLLALLVGLVMLRSLHRMRPKCVP
jgi:hypothetical protein